MDRSKPSSQRPRAALQQWATTSLQERSALLDAVARRLRTDSDALAATAVREMGKPIVQARAEIEKCAWACEYFAREGPAMLQAQDAPSTAARSYVAFRPLGVLLAIMPWNFPFWQVFRAVGSRADGGQRALAQARGKHHALRAGDRAHSHRCRRAARLFRRASGKR